MNTPNKPGNVVALPVPAMESGGKVAAIVPRTFTEAAQIAGAIVKAGMAPKGYENNPEKATVAILAGLEVGFTPFAALQSIAVINGTPTIFGDGLVALVRASGLLEDIQETVQVDEAGVPLVAQCRVKRKGEATWGEQTLTQAQCKRAGWWGKQGPWTLTPGRMMAIRCRGWAFRDRFADVLKGLKSAEEVQDMVDITPAAGPAPPEPQRKDFVDTSSAAPAPSDGQPVGQAVAPAPAAGGGTPSPSGQPAPDGDKPAVMDVVDQNEAPEKPKAGQQLVFEPYSNAKDMSDFADIFLPKTNAEGARQFLYFYEPTLEAMEKSKHKNNNDAAKSIRATVATLIASEPEREPGQDG